MPHLRTIYLWRYILLIFCCILFTTFPAEAGNLLPGETSFESGNFKDWANGQYVRLTPDPSTAFDGQCSARVDFISNGWIQSSLLTVPHEQDGKTFTFSIYVKADQDNVSASLHMTKLVGTTWVDGSCASQITLTKTWKRYSISRPLKEGDYWFGISVGESHVIWIDALQVEEGDAITDYKNNAEFYFDVSVPADNDYVFLRGDKVPVTIKGYNVDRYRQSPPLSLLIRISDHSGKTVMLSEEKTISMEGRFSVNHEFAPPALGWYGVHAELIGSSGKAVESSCSMAVVDPPVEIEKWMTPFCGVDGPYLSGIGRIGGNWSEVYIKWSGCEPTQGSYQWPDISWIKRNAQHCKLTLFTSGVPKWAWDPYDQEDCKKRQLRLPSTFLPSREHVDKWRTFIKQLVSHYKDQIDFIEVGAEDDLTFGGNPYYKQKYPDDVRNGYLVGGPAYERYAEMVKIACEEIKAVNGNLKIGIIRPSDVDCKGFAFSSPVIKRCSKIFDYLPLDCYCSPRYFGQGKTDPMHPEDFLPHVFKTALDACRISGNAQSLCISEFGYALDYNARPDSREAMEMVKRVARSYLVARMTPGVEFLHWFMSNGCIEAGKYHYGLWRFGLPMPTVPAYSAVAKIVENVVEAKELPFGSEVKAVIFRKHGRADAAVWFVHGNGRLFCDELPDGLVIADVMGNQVEPLLAGVSSFGKVADAVLLQESAKTSNIIDVGELPVYFKMDGNGAFDTLCKMFAHSKMMSSPLKMCLVTPRSGTGILHLQNLANEELEATISIIEGKSPSLMKSLKIGVGSENTIEFAMKTMTEAVNVTVDCGGNYEKVEATYSMAFEMCNKIKFTGKIDADLLKWKGRPFIEMKDRSQVQPSDPQIDWKGAEHFSAKVYTAWDERYFYLAADVRDDVHSNCFPAKELYKGDSIQFAFDPLADGAVIANHPPVKYGKDDVEMGIALTGKGVCIAQWAGENAWTDAEYAVRRDDAAKRTFYEMRISLSALGLSSREGTMFGFNFVIYNDDTGAGSNYWYQLTPGIADGKNPAAFKKFVFGKMLGHSND